MRRGSADRAAAYRRRAKQFLAAARVLLWHREPQPRWAVYLGGYAAELMFKAHLLVGGAPPELARPYWQHNLERLRRQARMVLDRDQEAALTRLAYAWEPVVLRYATDHRWDISRERVEAILEDVALVLGDALG